MKALKLSTLVLLLVSAISSCTKDYTTPTKPAGATDAFGNDKGTATIVDFNINPKPKVYYSSTVDITGTLKFDLAVNQFNVILQKSTTQDVDGNWIGFVDTDYKEQVNLGTQGEGRNKVNVTATTFPFKFTFPASELGVSKTGWRIHVTGGNANNAWIGDATLEIFPDPVCTGLSLTSSEPQILGSENGITTFKVQYTVNTCNVEFARLKLQGGLTAIAELLKDQCTGGLESWTVGQNDKNTILKWEETAALPEGTKTYTVIFTKPYSGSGPIELTGQWSVKAYDANGELVGEAETDPVSYSN